MSNFIISHTISSHQVYCNQISVQGQGSLQRSMFTAFLSWIPVKALVLTSRLHLYRTDTHIQASLFKSLFVNLNLYLYKHQINVLNSEKHGRIDNNDGWINQSFPTHWWSTGEQCLPMGVVVRRLSLCLILDTTWVSKQAQTMIHQEYLVPNMSNI